MHLECIECLIYRQIDGLEIHFRKYLDYIRQCFVAIISILTINMQNEI